MATTEILTFADDPAANVMDQTDYAALPAQLTGFPSGILHSEQLNKVLRQSSFVAAGVANWLVDNGINVPDDGDLSALATNIQDAITAIATSLATSIAAAAVSGSQHGYILLQDIKSGTTNGGTFTEDAWRTRTLNTEVADTGGNCSLASNQITLDAGTYECRISAPAFAVAGHQARLQNITDSATALTGTSEHIEVGADVTTRSVIYGRFTIASAKVFEVQHYCVSTKASTGFGNAVDALSTQVYTIAEFTKIN